MKRTFFISVILIWFGIVAAHSAHNPFFVGHRHQVAASFGIGTNHSYIISPPTKFVPFTEFHIAYSVPNEFFYFPGRMSINITQTAGWGDRYGWYWSSYSVPIMYLTQDIAMISGRRWYAGIGAGAGLQWMENDRIGSKFIMTFRPFIGYRISDRLALEFYMRHFSNGHTTDNNYSYNFYGLSLTFNF
ncbi:MAG: acyloxyacyl hydrolase [Alphaproteobacteria bacterium]|nr:acyloxyacyl hydrolase [Alphaproteobacteria bacterium]